MPNLKEQVEEIQRQIKQWQGDPSASAAMKRQLIALQSELDNLARQARTRPIRSRARLAVVQPKPPPQVALTPDEQSIWNGFFAFHRALLQYSGWVNRDQWLGLADVAADMMGGNPMLGTGAFPTDPGIWVWDGTTQLWLRTNGIPFPSGVTGIYGWDAGNQRWVLIGEGGGLGDMEEAPTTGQAYVRQNGLWVPLTMNAVRGVTDGSTAAPGTVGECVDGWNNPSSPNQPITGSGQNYIYLNAATMTLTAGDWDVSGYAYFDFNGAGFTAQFMQANLWVSPQPAPTIPALQPPQWLNDLASTSFTLQANWPDAGGPTIAERINITSTTTIYAITMCGSPTPTDNGLVGWAWATLHARRMR